jgi:hypothetical protein
MAEQQRCDKRQWFIALTDHVGICEPEKLPQWAQMGRHVYGAYGRDCKMFVRKS